MKKPPKINIKPQDLAMAAQFKDALEQTEDLPFEGRWAMTLELLPDSWLLYVVRARKRKPDDLMNLYGTLSIVATEEFLGDDFEDIDIPVPEGDAKTALATMAFYGIAVSSVAELERRHKHFTDDVIHMRSPFTYDPETPVQFVPKDPETFKIDQLFEYYQEHDS
ncbi:MAG TPA: hypothetical protein VFB21_02655 [Chthonomonadaceae bacterium]|nr:hypothetical protein [Chthonomonadaceae bacterium]